MAGGRAPDPEPPTNRPRLRRETRNRPRTRNHRRRGTRGLPAGPAPQDLLSTPLPLMQEALGAMVIEEG